VPRRPRKAGRFPGGELGPRNISRFLNDLARPHVVRERREEGYRAMAADQAREAEAAQWSEALVGDVADEPR
jgi:hypothetical protein